MKAERKGMIAGRNALDEAASREVWNVGMPHDIVSPLDLAGGLRAPPLSDDELDELCTIEIAALSRPKTNGTAGGD